MTRWRQLDRLHGAVDLHHVKLNVAMHEPGTSNLEGKGRGLFSPSRLPFVVFSPFF